jgi:hypothetical protein
MNGRRHSRGGGLTLLVTSLVLAQLSATPLLHFGAATPATALVLYGSLALITTAALTAVCLPATINVPAGAARSWAMAQAARTAPTIVIPSSHPDTPGRSRPRAPGRGTAALLP